MLKQIIKDLQQRHAQGLMRTRIIRDTAQRIHVQGDGKACINFSSNDYLGLANHPKIKSAAIQAIHDHGFGSGASQFVSGYHSQQHDFEIAIADFLGQERALVFSCGYMANIGILATICRKDTTIFADRLNHASLIDGALLSRSKMQRYAHCDMTVLEQQLNTTPSEKKIIVSDGVFSMDGAVAPLPVMTSLAKQYEAELMIDDAHGLGVLGKNGRGLSEHFHIPASDIHWQVGTLGKCFGGFGAFVCGSHERIEYLTQYARTATYTTALPSALMSAALMALSILESESWRREKLQHNVLHFQKRAQFYDIPLTASTTPIQTIAVGNNFNVMSLQRHLFKQGYWVGAIRPPTVPVGTARLRMTLSAEHDEQHIEGLLSAIIKSLKT